MAYAINILLLWLLQDHMNLTVDELRGLEELSRFIVFLYSEIWFRSPYVTDSAFLDLHTFQSLFTYERCIVVAYTLPHYAYMTFLNSTHLS